MNIRIIPMTEAYIEGVVAAINEADGGPIAQTLCGKGERDWDAFRGGLEKSLKNSDHVNCVAIAGNQVVGHLFVHRDSDARKRHRAIFGLTIMKDYTGQRLGTRFMANLLEAAASLRVSVLDSVVLDSNLQGLDFWLRKGFFIYGKKPDAVLRSGVLVDLFEIAVQIRRDEFVPPNRRQRFLSFFFRYIF